jgi:hypothetical protein
MNNEQFEKILEKRINSIKSVLSSKAMEYASEADRLHNFKVAARMNNCTSEQALWGMMTKHLVSVQDIVFNKEKPRHEIINEKIGDSINYLILLEALLKDNG